MKRVSVIIATELRAEVEIMIEEDPKMKGISRYLASVEIFWSTAIPTACAGSGFIFFNPNFYNKLPKPTRNTVMAHEVWHLILKHQERGKFFDPSDYNRAGDHVINIVLEEEGFIFDFGDMDFVPCKDIKYKNMSTEEVYNSIREEKKNLPTPLVIFPPDLDEDEDEDEDENKDKNENENEDKNENEDEDDNNLDLGLDKPEPEPHTPRSIIEDLIKAGADAIAGNDDYNNVPNQVDKDKIVLEELSISIGEDTGYTHIQLEITNRQIAIKDSTYEKIFEKYLIDPISGAKRSYMRPNRRMHGIKNAQFTLPGRVNRKHKSNRLVHLIYALDVSGSITTIQAQQFHDSVRTIKELLNPNLLTVLFFDTDIKLIKIFKDTEPYGKIDVRAGGCTSLSAVYAYAENRNPEAVVIFTDLCVKIPPKPKWHTIWLVPENHNEKTVTDLYGDIYIIPKLVGELHVRQ